VPIRGPITVPLRGNEENGTRSSRYDACWLGGSSDRYPNGSHWGREAVRHRHGLPVCGVHPRAYP